MMTENSWHSQETEDVFKRLDSGQNGLGSVQAADILNEYGPNELEEEKKASKLFLLFQKIKNPIIIILLVAALISLVIEHYYDALVIFIVIIIDMIIGFVQEFKAEAAMQALKSMTAPEAEVIRDGVELRIKAREIVAGDIILIDAGSKVPADGRVFESANLEIDESMLTGESATVRKTTQSLKVELPVEDRKNMVFSGTLVTHGRGKAIVVATGMKTQIGKIASLLKETEKAQTPIQRRTLDLSKKLSLIAIVTSAITFVLALLAGFGFLESFLFVLAAAVSAIPQGLPIVVTITLAIGVRRMAKRNAIIRKLQAVDTLGSATVICTDKTGTLTTNQMTVRKILSDNRIMDVTGAGFNPEGEIQLNGQPVDVTNDKSLKLLLQTATLCSDARLRLREINGEARWEIYGDPTEGALVVAAAKVLLHKEALEEEHLRIDEIPFDAKERYMVTFHKTKNGKVDVYVKGAPETILDMCSEIVENGNKQKLSEQKKMEILQINTQMASDALRVLAMAHQTIDVDQVEDYKESIQQKSAKLIFVGLMGMIDPPRQEAKEAVFLCKRAGIRVVMATGDQKLTAQAIAKELAILDQDMKVLTGAELDGMNDEEIDSIIESTSVFSRVSPTHKHRIVESLRRKGHIVAMTGDGVNDAPALKAAEIGVAMGITGTDVTKETADMILTDDNFATIVNAVEEGRVVFENIRKVVKYLISTNAGEILTILGALIFLPGVPLIFTPVQILWVNLVTDGVLDKVIAMEPKEKGVMNDPPRNPNENIINRNIMLNTVFVGVFMAIGTLWIFTAANPLDPNEFLRARTLAFATIAMFQVFNALNCRSRTDSVFKIGFFTNKYLVIAVFISTGLTILATTLPPLQLALGTVSLSIWDWLIIFLVSSSVFIADESRKLVRSIYLRMKER
jgi:P-type Ca2+ transporter type 2C